MGFVSDIIGGLTGDDAADAAGDASQAQLQATREAIEAQKEAREIARADLAPFRAAGEAAITDTERQRRELRESSRELQTRARQKVSSFVSNPNKQRNYIENNPFFDALADNAQDRLFNNQAARGKVGSGETAEALQNSILLLGTDLVNQQVQQRALGINAEAATFGARNAALTQSQNIVSAGGNAAAGQATATQNAGNTIADLTTQGGNAQASGFIGAANARTGAVNNLVDTGIAALSLSDARAKTDVKRVGTTDGGTPVYVYRYKGDTRMQMGVMAQEVPEAAVDVDGVLYVDYRRVA